MVRHYSVPQWIAMALGGGLLGLQTWLLLEHALAAPGTSSALIASVPFVTVTLAAIPSLMEACLRARAPLKALGLLLVFGLLVGYSLPQAIGRAGEVRDVKIAEAKASHRPLRLLQEELRRALVRVDDADREVKRECTGGFGPKCDGWQRTMAERQARADQLTGDIAKLAPPKIGASDAPRIAAVLGISEAAVNLYQPLFLPVAMELGVWVLLWLAFSPTMMREVPRSVSELPKPATVPARPADPVVDALAAAGRPLSNQELAQALGVSEGQAVKLVARRQHLIRKDRDGRQVAISLLH